MYIKNFRKFQTNQNSMVAMVTNCTGFFTGEFLLTPPRKGRFLVSVDSPYNQMLVVPNLMCKPLKPAFPHYTSESNLSGGNFPQTVPINSNFWHSVGLVFFVCLVQVRFFLSFFLIDVTNHGPVKEPRLSLGWFSHRTGTPDDDGACKSNWPRLIKGWIVLSTG